MAAIDSSASAGAAQSASPVLADIQKVTGAKTQLEQDAKSGNIDALQGDTANLSNAIQQLVSDSTQRAIGASQPGGAQQGGNDQGGGDQGGGQAAPTSQGGGPDALKSALLKLIEDILSGQTSGPQFDKDLQALEGAAAQQGAQQGQGAPALPPTAAVGQ